MERASQGTPAFRDSYKSIDAPVFDNELEGEIKDILRLCGTHTATISIRRQLRSDPPEHQVKTIVTTGDPVNQRVTTDEGERFHIASITKILIATAIIIAVEKEATEGVSLDRFRHTQNEPLTRVYNQYRPDKMKAFSGSPTTYDLLVHCQGFPSLNHRMLTPDGQPIMGLANVQDELLSQIARVLTDDEIKPWAGYSNVNYTAVAMAIEAMSNGSLESFMNETLFQPLGMHSTSIGVPTNELTENKGWVVDSNCKPHEIQRPLYRADGAEAAALGVYSTAHDLDRFFDFIIQTFHCHQPISGFDLIALSKVLKMTYITSGSLRFTPLGLYTPLSSSVIGALSTNRAQFPDKPFSTYPVVPEQGQNEISVYYMAGSAIACSCATAFHVGQENSFAVVVLTNTSGPVDAADHILRLVLQRMTRWIGKPKSSPRPTRSSLVREMVKQARAESLRKWQEVEQKQAQEVNCAPAITKDIEGVFIGDGFSQRLVISKEQNGKTYITVNGPLTSALSTKFELVWVDNSSVKMHIPPHLSVDWLGEGDWSNVIFRVEDKDEIAVTLVRTTPYGEDRFSRSSSIP